MKTKVKFLVDENVNPNLGPDIYAFFPTISNTTDQHTRLSYSRVGQHSQCCISYANESREATKGEYTPLQEELESIGYKLQILNK